MRLSLSVLTAAALTIVGCGEDSGTNPDPDPGPGNTAPTAQAAASPSAVPAGDNFQTIVTLNGTGSSDPDGDPLTFQWTVPSGRFEGGTSASDSIARVSFPGAAPYTVSLRVTDGRGGDDTDQVVVSIQ